MATAKNLAIFDPATIPSAEKFSFAIIVSEWNSDVTSALQKGAEETLIACKARKENIQIMNVPGSFELSGAAAMVADKLKYDSIICLGCIIQGETRHFEFIAQAVSIGLTKVSIQYKIPVVFGVLTTNNLQQALERSGGKLGNKGIEAALTAIKMLDFKNRIK